MNEPKKCYLSCCLGPSRSRMWPAFFCHGLGLHLLSGQSSSKTWIRLQIKFILFLHVCLCQKGVELWMNSENIHVVWVNLCMGSFYIIGIHALLECTTDVTPTTVAKVEGNECQGPYNSEMTSLVG